MTGSTTEALTAATIDTLEAGPEMDALVAERVMGHTEAEYDGDVWYSKAPGAEYAYRLPSYSTDIAAAWEVVEKMMLRGYIFESRMELDKAWNISFVELIFTPFGPSFGDKGKARVEMDEKKYQAITPTAPLAICRAALKAVLAK